MAEQGYPLFGGQPKGYLYVFKVDGSEVTATSSSAGLDGRGQAIADIKNDGANVQTITWKRKFEDTPYVFLQALTANGSANITTNDGETLVLTGVERDDNTATLNDQDFFVYVYSHDTTQYIL